MLNATAMGFTLGALTLEQTKHLQARDAGPLTGMTQLPGLRAWRQRLGAIGDRVDPLALQRRMTAALLGHLPPEFQVWSPGIFVDISIMLLLVPNCQIGARNPLGLPCRADVVSGRDCNIARCSRTRRS